MPDETPEWSAELRARLAALRLKPEREADIVEELSQHLDDRWRELVAAGASAEEATRTIATELANRDRLKDYLSPLRQARQPPPLAPDSPAGSLWGDLWRDVRYAARTLLASRAFTAVAVVSLALGIGANAAVFSLINALVLRPIPGVERPDSLVQLTNGSFSYAAFEELRQRQIFASTVAFQQQRLASRANETTQRSNVVLASGDFYSALGVSALLGRTLTPADELTRAPVAVLSHAFWLRAFAADRGVLGTTIEISRTPVTIVGVTPPEFTGLYVGWPADVTVPATLAPQVYPELRADILTRKTGRWLNVLGRLAPEQSLEEANARLQTVWPEVMAAASPLPPTSTAAPPTELVSAENGLSRLRGTYLSPLYVLMGLVAAVLLIACANVATLLLARAAVRQRELAIRLAAGAGRGRLIRQLLTEAVLLAAAAAAAGTLLAVAAPRMLMRFIAASGQPAELNLGPDWRVFAFAVAMMLATILLFGLLPALRATRLDVAGALKEHARALTGGTRLRRGLVVAQIALSMLLAVGAALFTSSLRQVLAVDRGFDATNVLLVRADALSAGYTGERNLRFFTELVDRVSALPYVQSVAISWAPPVSRGLGSGGPIRVEGTPVDAPQRASQNWVSPRYFETIGQTLVLGRPFGVQDARGAPAVAVVNETFARRYLGENPLGKRFDPDAGSDFAIEVVGVVRDSPYSQVKDPASSVFYVPYAQGPPYLETQNMVLEVRSREAWNVAARDVRELLAAADPNVIVDVETLQDHVDGSLASDRLLALLSGLLGALSLLLVAIGLYGVMAYSVTQRTAEIGLRIALGARSRSVLSMVLGDAFRLVAAGTVVGAAAALGASRLIASLLYGVAPRDAAAFVAAAAAMALVALLASLLPARRAARVDPIVALRYE